MEKRKKEDSFREEIHLLDYLLILAKRSRLIVLTTLGIMVLTYLFLFLFVPVQYTATARLLPPQQSLTLSGQLLEGLGLSSLPGVARGLGGLAAGLLGIKNPGDIYVGILSGDNIADRMISRFNLRELYEKRYLEDTRKKLRKNTVLQAQEDGLLLIEVTDTDPKRAAEMANAYGEELDKLLQEIALREARNQLNFLEQERAQALANLNKAEEEMRTFSEKSGVIQLDAQVSRMISYVATLRAEIDAKEVQIQVLKKQATPFNFEVIRLETEVNSLKEKLREAERQVDQACLGEVCLPTSKVPGLGLEYLRLLREAKYRHTLYEVLCKMVELARLDTAKNIAVARVQFVDQATPPERKSKPQRVWTSLIVGFATFVLLIFAAFFREFWERSCQEEHSAARLQQLRIYLSEWKMLFLKLRSVFKTS